MPKREILIWRDLGKGREDVRMGREKKRSFLIVSEQMTQQLRRKEMHHGSKTMDRGSFDGAALLGFDGPSVEPGAIRPGQLLAAR
jgi:hypothetical protein